MIEFMIFVCVGFFKVIDFGVIEGGFDDFEYV